MLRNEGDIILPFLRHCAEFFDALFVADVRATDGTARALRDFQDPRLRLHVHEVFRQERYQGALINLLSRRAFAQGADWVFCLDGDEFLSAENRAALERTLRDLGADVMAMPWLNLVPTRFGSFASFDMAQAFHWSGELSTYSKIAISSLFAANHPGYCVHEGNHAVSPAWGMPAIEGQPGPPLLHLPVRSLERLKYRIGLGLRLVRTKHDRAPGEGGHADSLDALLGRGAIGAPELRFLAASYGTQVATIEPTDPEALGWPVRRLPDFLLGEENGAAMASLSETLQADAALTWDRTSFTDGSVVGARLEGDRIRLVPQPMRGNGQFRDASFAALGPAIVPQRFPESWLSEIVAGSCTPIRAWATSAWTELIPVMSTLFVLLRPRRYVELGVHNGMSFFAACQIAEKLALDTECVAVDSWVGDAHAGYHDVSVFDAFRRYLAETYPDQCFIQAYFAAALACFDDGSIDLLHIDGLHTYEAVKQDFETWLPKLSDVGVIIFHDTNEFARDFGVWRLWEELRQRYPAFAFGHQHGLGIVYVGREPHPFGDLLRRLSASATEATLAQAYFQAVGTLLAEQRGTAAALEGERARVASLVSADPGMSAGEVAEMRRRLGEAEQDLAALQAQHAALLASTSWRVTAPMRAVARPLPGLRGLMRRGMNIFR